MQQSLDIPQMQSLNGWHSINRKKCSDIANLYRSSTGYTKYTGNAVKEWEKEANEIKTNMQFCTIL